MMSLLQRRLHEPARRDVGRDRVDAPGVGAGPPRRWKSLLVRARTERTLVAGVVVAVLLAIAIVALLVWIERERVLDEGGRTATRLAHLLEEQTVRSFQAVDLTLAGIVDSLRLAPALPDHDAAFQDMLRLKRAALPQVRALFVIGPYGYITQDTDHPYTPRVSLADRGYFRVHVDDPGRGLHIARPLITRSGATWFVSLSRRIDAPDGRFVGVAVAAVEPTYFEHFYRDLRLGPRDSIALFQRDGTLIARHPRQDDFVGQSAADRQLFRARLPAATAGSFRAEGVDRVPRIMGYRAIEPLALVVTVALAEPSLLAGWWRGTLIALAVTAVATLLVGVLTVVLVRQARQRAAAREQLLQAQKLEALGRMTGIIAHDFGNVLAAVSMHLEVLRRMDNGRQGAVVQAAADAVRQGTALASRLLAFARRQQLQVQTVDANGLVSAIEPLLRQAAPAPVLTADLAHDLWRCRADESQLAVALVNLVMNSRDAMNGHGGGVRIVTRNCHVDARSADAETPPGDYVRVSVIDQGAGMPPQVLRRATEPFFTTKGARGTGLGLSQVYGFVRQVGGTLRIETEVGVGTAVHLLFRRAADATSLTGTASER